MNWIRKFIIGGCCLCLTMTSFYMTAAASEEGQDKSAKREWADEWSGDDSIQWERSGTMELQEASPENKMEVSATKIIVLDPGHDDTHAGARGNGLEEEDLVLKIAKYCKTELESYEGVQVYMTRNSGGCPYPGTTSIQCNSQRVKYAKSVGTTAYISIHLNASASSAPYGAEVYYPNLNYRSDIGKAGAGLAQGTLTKLISLGINNRGFMYRNSEDNSLYPDGSLADYYGVIKNSKLSGFPGIIIEHGFITNASDVQQYLNSEEKLQKLGIADAAGIAEYYGLKKKNQNYTEKDLKLKAVSNADGSKYTIMAEGIPNSNSVQFAVWSMEQGQDDLKWLSTKKNTNGSWTADAVISDFKTEGIYVVHAYITRQDGSIYFVGETNFTVTCKSSVENVIVSDINQEKGTFQVTLEGVSAPNGIASIYIPIWTEADQSDIRWYQPEKISDTTYAITIKAEDHNGKYGVYHIHAYIRDNNGIMKNVGITDVFLSKEKHVISAQENEMRGYFDLTAMNIPYSSSQVKVTFAVWSEEGGQDDIQWHNGENLGSGSWKTSIYIPPTASLGNYFIHAYVIQYNGTMELIGNTNMTVTSSNIGSGLKGDADLNDDVNIDDVTLSLKAALTIQELVGEAFINADINGNQIIELEDVREILKMALTIDE